MYRVGRRFVGTIWGLVFLFVITFSWLEYRYLRNHVLEEAHLSLGEVRRFMLGNVMIALTGMSALVIATWFIFRRLVTRPLREIESYVKAIEGGSEVAALTPLADNEIGLLGRTIAGMRGRLREEADMLAKKNEELTAVQSESRASQAYLASLFRTIPDAILVMDPAYTVTDLNPAACNIFGLRREDAIGRKCHEISHGRGEPCDFHVEICPLRRVLDTGKEERAVHVHITSNGERHIEITASLLDDNGGRGPQVIEVLRDITAMVRSGEIIQQKSAELEALIYALGHDLKAPIANIKGFVGLMEEGTLSTEQTRYFLSRVQYNTDTMGRLINDLLDLSRIGIRQEPADNVDSEEIVREAIQTLEQKIAERGAVVTVGTNFPTVRYPRTRLLQVFTNIVGNALVHTTEQTALRIEISVAGEIGAHVFRVNDNGPGIDPVEQARIFEPFHPRANKVPGSSGLGLAIVKRIVEKNGGKIRLESAMGTGTTFIFSVPA